MKSFEDNLMLYCYDLLGDICALLNCREAIKNKDGYFSNLNHEVRALYLQRILDYIKQNTEEVLWLSGKVAEELAEHE